MARLKILLGDGERLEHALTGDVTTIGYAADNLIRILDRTVSGHHARVTKVAGRYLFEDLNSTNGSFLNGNRVKTAPLDDQDKLILGVVECEFEGDPIERPASLPKPPRSLPKLPRHRAGV